MPANILIVEDEADLALMMRYNLEAEGFRVLTASSGEVVELTTGEFDMLAVLVKHPGRVMTRETLMELTRGRSWDAFDRTIDAQIARLRKKIEAGAGPKLIKSVRGIGYVFAGRVAGESRMV